MGVIIGLLAAFIALGVFIVTAITGVCTETLGIICAVIFFIGIAPCVGSKKND